MVALFAAGLQYLRSLPKGTSYTLDPETAAIVATIQQEQQIQKYLTYACVGLGVFIVWRLV